MKKIIIRMTAMVMAVFTMAIMTAIPVTAFAADNEVVAVAVREDSASFAVDENGVITIQPMVNTYAEPTIQQLGNGQQGQGQASPATGQSGSSSADTAYKDVMTFITTWIRRLGAAVALFGAIMLALGLKRDEADQKENGIKTMIAGFVVWAICGALNLFDLFT